MKEVPDNVLVDRHRVCALCSSSMPNYPLSQGRFDA